MTRTGEYALRAMIYLVQHAQDGPIPGRVIADEAGIPPKYLSKILGDLVRLGVLLSSPGRGGGFSLKRSARDTLLFEVLSPFEQFERRRCPFGNDECSYQRPCLAHKKWKRVFDTEQRFLRGTSVWDVAVRNSKKSRTTKRKQNER